MSYFSLTDVLRSVGDRASPLSDHLVGVHSDLHDIVDEREQWRQWKGSDENRNEAILNDCNTTRAHNRNSSV